MAEFPYSARATSKFKSPPGSAVPFSFAVGDSLKVLAADDEGEWLEGETTTGSRGWFPSASIERVGEEEEQAAQPVAEEPKPKQDADTTSAGVDSGPEQVEEPVIVAAAAAAAPAAAPVSASTPAAPTRQPSLPASSSNDTPASSPPEVAKKPGSLRDRIAALNAQGAGAAGPPPPLPRAKPPAFKRAPIPTSLPSAASSAPTSEQPSVSVSSSSSPPAVEKSGDKPAFSAEDAKESIGKGGSLKDRIAALQNMTLDAPAPPGRAPKPWKKKSVEVPVEQEEGSAEAEKPATELSEGAKEDMREGQVKDELPREEETTAQSPGAEVPQFSPASPPSASPAPEAHPFVAPPVKEDDDDEVNPISNAAQEATSPTTAAPQEDKETEEPVDEETAQRSAIAARMAGLGGQRVGMAMPALPKRAGPPRRRAAAPAAAAAVASPTEEEQSPGAPSAEKDDIVKQEAAVEPQGGEEEVAEVKPVEVEAVTPVGQTIDESTPVNEPALAEAAEQEPAHDEQDSLEREVAAPVTLGGGAQSLLRSVEVQDSDDEDEFDTPALPKAESDDEFDTPALPEASSPVVQPTRALEPEEFEKEEHTPLGSEDVEQDHVDPVDPVETVHSAPPPPPGRPAMPPPPPPAQPPRDDSDEEQVEEDEAEEPRKPDLSIETAQLDDSPLINDASPTPTSPATASRPAIPAIPASFAAARPSAPAKERLVIPRSVAPEEEEDGDVVSVPTSPATAHRPAIPGIPASFAPPSPAKMQPIMPLRQPEPEEEDEEEEEQYADVQGTPQGEAVDSPMDPALPPRVAPAVPKAMPPPPPSAAAQEEEEPQQAEAGDEQEEEDEEDPEVARRAALAARMAKLGGMNMRMGMPMPPVGGMRKPATKKKSAPLEEASEPAAVEEQDEEAPAPPRRLPGFPAGAVALPGMPTRKVVDPEPEPELEPTGEAETEQEDEQEAEPVQEDHTEQVMEEPESPMAPPPLPAGRPSSMLPPRRSVPTPQATEDDQDGSSAPPPPPLPSGRPLPPPPQIASQFVEEPEMHDEPFEQVSEEAAPPAPARPQGGLPPVPSSTTYSSPPLPPTASPPSSPPSRRTSIFKSTSKRESVTSLDHAPAATRTSMDSTRSFGGGVGYLGEDTAPQRTNSTSSAAGQGHPLPSLPESGGGGGHSFAPEQLAHFSSTLGAQVFAAAHSKLNDKSAREQSGENLVLFGLSRATDPAAPRGASYGASVLAVEGTAKGKPSVLNEVDEPRAGDVIVFHDTKFKHNLSTTRVGSADRPHVAVVASWDPSKRKVKTIEVGNGGAVVEGAHRLEDLKSGKVVVWRVLPREV